MPGTDEDCFESPSLFIKYNGNFGYSKWVFKQDRRRLIFSQKSKPKHAGAGSIHEDSKSLTERTKNNSPGSYITDFAA